MTEAFFLNDGSLFVIVEAPGGLYNTDQLTKIAQIAARFNSVIKVTEDQRIGLFVLPENLASLKDELAAVGLEYRHYARGLHQPVSCLGAQCPNHLQDCLATSIEITEMLEGINLNMPLRIGVNGCSQCCVPIHTLDIALLGNEKGYNLYIGGKNSLIPEFATFVAEGIPATEVASYVLKIVNKYKELANENESLKEVIDRCGLQVFIQELHPYSQDAAVHDTEDPFGKLDEIKERLTADNNLMLEEKITESSNSISNMDIDINIKPDGFEFQKLNSENNVVIEIEAEEEPISISDYSSDKHTQNSVEDDIEQKLDQEIAIESQMQKHDNATENEESRNMVLESIEQEQVEESQIITNETLNADLEDIDDQVEENDESDDVTYLSEDEILMDEQQNVRYISKGTEIANDKHVSQEKFIANSSSNFKGFKYQDNSVLCIFENGKMIKINVEKLLNDYEYSLNFEDAAIYYMKDANGITIKVNEIEIYYPLQNVAA